MMKHVALPPWLQATLLVALPLWPSIVSAQEIERFPAEGSPGLARAVRVADAPLAHTAMMLGWSASSGAIEGDARAQAKQALQHTEAALAAVGSSLAQAVKLHFYLARDDDAPAAHAAVAERFAGRPVAVSWVTTTMTDPAALVGVDAVAVAPASGAPASSVKVRIGSAPQLPKPIVGAPVAVLPAGRRIYFSGQAERDADLRGATKKTMASLGQTLEWMKATKADVAQVKAFVRPFGEHRAAAEEIAAFFGSGAAPPCVFVEWSNASNPAEIEMIVAGRSASVSVVLFRACPPRKVGQSVRGELRKIGSR